MGESEEREERFIAAAIHSALTPREFEALVARLYEHQGYTTDLRPEGADQGIDFIAEKTLTSIAVQVKRYDPDASTVGSPVVRETIGSARAINADDAHIVTSSLFTTPAQEAATDIQGMDVQLVDGVELVEQLHEYGVAVEAADSDLIANATAAESGAAFTSALLSESRRGASENELERAVRRYVRKQLAENQDEIEATVKELGGYLVEQARAVDWSDRGQQVRTRLGERSGDVSDRLGTVREGALERAGLVRDQSGQVRDAAAMRADTAKEAISEKTDEAKSKASEAKDSVADTADDLKDRFL